MRRISAEPVSTIAERYGITGQAVRVAIRERRLAGEKIGPIWVVDSRDAERVFGHRRIAATSSADRT